MLRKRFLLSLILGVVLTIAFVFFQGNRSTAQTGSTEFQLNVLEGATSHVYRPFTYKNDSDKYAWSPDNGYGHNEGTHVDSDKYAEDWNLIKLKETKTGKEKTKEGVDDCGYGFLSPISGTVLFSGHVSLTESYGEQVVVRSDINPTFAFRVAHLIESSNSHMVAGQRVEVGSKLGQVGTTGKSTGCHAHVALYRNLDQPSLVKLASGGYLTDESYAALFDLNANFVASCPQSYFKGEFFNSEDLTGNVVFSACYKTINFDWGTNEPVWGLVNKDNFSARFAGGFPLRTGRYLISTRSQGVLGVYFNDSLVIAGASMNQVLTDEAEVTVDNLNSIEENVRVVYYDTTGASQIMLNISLIESLNNPPVVTDIPDQFILSNEDFALFDLDDYGHDPDLGDVVNWSYSGNSQLGVNIDENNVVDIQASQGFVGNESITFIATDNYGMAASTEAIFGVEQACNYTVRANDVGDFVRAIDFANNNPDVTTICLPENSSYPFSTVHNTIYGNVGVGVIGTPIIIEGNGATMTRDLRWNVAMRFFSVASNGNLTLNNINLYKGGIFMDPYGGGAILNLGGRVRIKDSTVSGNTARVLAGGGAIRNNNGGIIDIENVEFIGNTTDLGGNGGVIFNAGNSIINIINSSFSLNFSQNNGGVIYNHGEISIQDSSIVNNTANNNGGALFIPSGRVTLNNVVFTGNRVQYVIFGTGEGGGAFVDTAGTLIINGSKLQNNYAGNRGGFLMNKGTTNISSSCISGNNYHSVYSTVSMTAENNWWGASNGPSGGGSGSGDWVSTVVDFTPFLTSQPESCSL